MRHGGDKSTLDRARQLRRNLTKPERLLWATLRRKQRSLRFRQQHPAGPYVLDFYCPSAKLCVEVDGSHHDQTVAADKRRDRWLAKHGVRVFRIAATDVLADPDAVADWIAFRGHVRQMPASGRNRAGLLMSVMGGKRTLGNGYDTEEVGPDAC